ncbi:MAG TPA: GGDEF domain-containing protein [Vicinamibacterales bacterium]|nr:GGDEF domain-containing protein [Vicinamibacterales bacterium]
MRVLRVAVPRRPERTMGGDVSSSLIRRWTRAISDWGDPVSRALGVSGDLYVARFRLGLLLLLTLIPLTTSVAEPDLIENWLGLASIGVALLVALWFLSLAARPIPPAWLGFATSQFDVAIISLGFVSFVFAGRPIVATNSLVQYTMYYVALAGTGLRYDPRVCLSAGLSAVVQYGLIVAWVAFGEPAVYQASPVYGTFQWDSQMSRLQLLAIATVIHTSVVIRSRRFWLSSMRDRLTGLYNRGFFDEGLLRLIVIARQTSTSFSVALIDIDHFKHVNDRYGHATGDRALGRAADRLRDCFRDEDLIARWGGEEFAVILQAHPGTAAARLDAWRASLAADGTPPALSASVGVATYPDDGATPETLMRAADRRLYMAKARGRNRTIARDDGDAA